VLAVPTLAAVKVLYDFLCPRLRIERRDEFGANAISQHPRHEVAGLRPKSMSEEARA
jgi:hypothetical protein